MGSSVEDGGTAKSKNEDIGRLPFCLSPMCGVKALSAYPQSFLTCIVFAFVGQVISLADRRAAHRAQALRRSVSRAEFFFDLACPFSYLAAERVERGFDRVVWTPVTTAALTRGAASADPAAFESLRAAAEVRAKDLRMPLVWPDRAPADVPNAMRAASLAAERGRGGAFVLAAGRLAFCGGFDLDDPEILAEAAAAAGLGLEDCLRAAGDIGRDGAMESAGRRLLAAGADRLPALRVGRALFWGEGRVGEASSAARLAAASPAR
jgi:2-hydroxychromene-2-carboxylate isomerase